MAKSTVSNQDVVKARSNVEKLREQLADVEAKITESESDRTNKVQVEQFSAEEERLRQQLEAAKNRLKLSQASTDRVIDQLQAGGAYEESSADILVAEASSTTKKEG